MAGMRSISRRKARQTGVVLFMAVVCMSILVPLAIVLSQLAILELNKSGTLETTTQARMTAEGGLSYMESVLESVRIDGSPSGSDLLVDLAEVLTTRLNGALAGRGIQVGNETVELPTIYIDKTTSFDASLHFSSEARDRLTVEITGRDSETTRTVSAEMKILQGRTGAYVYGLAIQGQIILEDGAFIRGINSDGEADVYTSFAGAGWDRTCRMAGLSEIAGRLYVTDTRDVYTQCRFRGNPSIAGEDLWTGPTYIWDMVYTGSASAEFPTVDLAKLTPLATHAVRQIEPYVDGRTGRRVTTVENIRILANANPTISGDMTLTGVIYIEAPNIVRFDNGAQITGIIVTADGSSDSARNCRIEFDGSFEIKGVDQLPAASRWDTLRAMSGTSIVAPGFTIEFARGDSRADGVIACRGFTLSSRATLTVKGGVLVYGDGAVELSRRAGLYVDKAGQTDVPAGFEDVTKLDLDAASYRER